MSVVLNGLLTGDKGKPLCYTAYDKKSNWRKFFDTVMFWDKQHCRKVWLSYKIHNRPKIEITINRDDYKTEFEWGIAISEIDELMNHPCIEGHTWLKEEHYLWTPEPPFYKDWTIKLTAVPSKENRR